MNLTLFWWLMLGGILIEAWREAGRELQRAQQQKEADAVAIDRYWTKKEAQAADACARAYQARCEGHLGLPPEDAAFFAQRVVYHTARLDVLRTRASRLTRMAELVTDASLLSERPSSAIARQSA